MKIKQAKMSFNAPTIEEGHLLHKLAKEAGGLDVNTEYAYLLLGAHFSETCAIAKSDGNPAGFASAYIVPGKPDTLFVWQIAVGKNYRGQGLAKSMIKQILSRDACKNINNVEATVSPSNDASMSVFRSLAKDLDGSFNTAEYIKTSHFSSGDHEDEPLIQIKLPSNN